MTSLKKSSPDRPLTREAELLVLIADQSRRVRIPLIVLTGLMALFTSRYIDFRIPLAWFGFMLLLSIVHSRVLVVLPQRRQVPETRRIQQATLTFSVHSLGLVSLLAVFPLVPFSLKLVLSLYVLGLITSTLPAVMGHPLIYRSYVAVQTLPLIGLWALIPDPEFSNTERLFFCVLIACAALTFVGHARGVFALFSSTCTMRLERFELTQQLRGALALAEAANAAKSRFLASASHDLRQPIHALALFSGALSLRELDPKSRHIAQQIEKTTVVLANQMDSLLDISRLDAGVIHVQLEVIDLNRVIEQLLLEFLPLAEQKQLTLVVTPFAQTYVQSDGNLLIRILQNLFANAIKYTRSGGIKIGVKALGVKQILSIEDTGIGIAEADHETIFEEFYQINNPDRDRSKGLGLGLSIVRRLTKLLGITLRMESNVGAGTCFWLELATSPQARILQQIGDSEPSAVISPPTSAKSTWLWLMMKQRF